MSDSGSVPAGAKRIEKAYCAVLCGAMRGSSGQFVTTVVMRTTRCCAPSGEAKPNFSGAPGRSLHSTSSPLP